MYYIMYPADPLDTGPRCEPCGTRQYGMNGSSMWPDLQETDERARRDDDRENNCPMVQRNPTCFSCC